MAERSAIASGLSFSDIGTAGGGSVATGGTGGVAGVGAVDTDAEVDGSVDGAICAF